jgi:hypothetical protein
MTPTDPTGVTVRRHHVPLHLSTAEQAPVQAIADREHGGNLSAAIRTLLAEALTARTGLEPGRWWRVVYDGPGAVWCETSNEREAREALKTCPRGGVLQLLWERTDQMWRPVPASPDPTEETP